MRIHGKKPSFRENHPLIQSLYLTFAENLKNQIPYEKIITYCLHDIFYECFSTSSS